MDTTNTMDTKKTTVSNVKVRYIRPRYQDLKEWMEDDGNEYIGRHYTHFFVIELDFDTTFTCFTHEIIIPLFHILQRYDMLHV